jgi:SAM-dependent methyltransferase
VRRELVQTYVRPRPGLRVLDLGCGPGDLIEHLPGVSYTGTDLSAAYIDSARRRFGDRGRYFVGGVEDLDAIELGEFDVVVAKSLLHHIDRAAALHLFDLASGVLAEDGRLVTLDAAYTSEMSRASRFIVGRDRGQSILTPDGYEALARMAFADVAASVHHDLLRIPYTHVFLCCSRPLPAESRITPPTSDM